MSARDIAHALLAAQRAMQEMRFEDARAAYAGALQVAPYSIDALRGLGFALLQLGQLAASLDALERALKVDRSDLLSLLLMGRLCLRLQQPAAARAHFAQILARMPGSEAARSGLIDALVAQGDLTTARKQSEALLRERPDAEVAGLAAARMAFYDRDDARSLELFSRLASAHPHNPAHRYNRALSLLRLGRYREGWNDYEQRFAAGAVHVVLPDSPRWNGEAAGHLLVVAEQGLGDTMLFARFLKQAAQRVGRVTLACPASLRPLLARSLGIDCVAAPAGGAPPDGWPQHDAHVPLMSLPHLLGACAGAVGPQPAWIAPDSQHCDAWSQAMGPAEGPRIGLVHAASVAHSTEANPFLRRSCSPAGLRALLRLDGVAVFNLNTGPAAEEARCELPGLRDLPLPLDDFDDTVAAMRCLDAVVSVDTAAAHVAGASGVPLFLLLPYSRDWRWTPLDGRAPWYGDVRAYAQVYPGDWAEPVRRLVADLAQFAAGR